jgi:hypothetical protein
MASVSSLPCFFAFILLSVKVFKVILPQSERKSLPFLHNGIVLAGGAPSLLAACREVGRRQEDKEER